MKRPSARLRFQVLQRDRYTCQYCGRDDAPLMVDHVRPWWLVRSNALENLITACADCNLGKGAVPLKPAVCLWLGQRAAAEEVIQLGVVCGLHGWCVATGSRLAPTPALVRRLIERYGWSEAAYALKVTSRRVARDGLSSERWLACLHDAAVRLAPPVLAAERGRVHQRVARSMASWAPA